jgi:hypothetical protein
VGQKTCKDEYSDADRKGTAGFDAEIMQQAMNKQDEGE